MVNLDRYGNTSTASIPIATCEAVDEGRLKPGDKVVFVGFGAGLTWGAAVAIVERALRRQAQSPPGELPHLGATALLPAPPGAAYRWSDLGQVYVALPAGYFCDTSYNSAIFTPNCMLEGVRNLADSANASTRQGDRLV